MRQVERRVAVPGIIGMARRAHEGAMFGNFDSDVHRALAAVPVLRRA